jgi:ABC-type bacteriocin/lantibiotic exporter with double-glycine peptidase domain
MILGHFGRKTRLEECRSVCEVGRSGAAVEALLEGARQFGLRGLGFRIRAAGLSGVPLPCIIQWNQNHFVVLERWSPAGAEIVDPGQGRRKIPPAEFLQSFSGMVLHFQRGPDLVVHDNPSLNPLLTYFRGMIHLPGARGLLVRIAGASLLLQVFGFALPLLTKGLVDYALPLGSSGMLNALLWGALLVAFTHAMAAYLRASLLLRLQHRLDSHLMLHFFRHLMALPFRFFQLRITGDLLMRLGSNTTIREALATHTTSAVLDVSLVISFLAVLLYVSPSIGIAALAFALIQLGILLASARRLHGLAEHNIACQSASQSRLLESLMGISTLKASGAEHATFARWSRLWAKEVDSSRQRGRYVARIEAVMILVRTLSPLFLLWLGARLVLDGALSLGAMLAVNGLAAAFLQPVASLVLSGQRLQLAGALLERIADVMQAEPEQDSHKVESAPHLMGSIQISNLSFRYDAHSPDVVRNISLSILPGQKVALVGRTGCGKSTLAKLLLGLYLPTEGEIRYDGIPLHCMNLQSLRRKWGSALQDPFLFNASLRDNISLLNPGMSSDDLVRAAETAEIHTDIMDLPMGYETRMDELGQSFSGGQRQRIAIARAIAGAPTFLLLDEATSHLDPLTERAVERNLDRLCCTRIVIAHRLSTIQNADLIVVLENGAIVEQGSHHQLRRRGGIYAALVGELQGQR